MLNKADHFAACRVEVASLLVKPRKKKLCLAREIAHLDVGRLLRLTRKRHHQRRIADVVNALAETLPLQGVDDTVRRSVDEDHRLVGLGKVVVRAQMVSVVAERGIAAQVGGESILAAVELGILRTDMLVGVPRAVGVRSHLVPYGRTGRVRRVLGGVVPVPAVPGLVKDVTVRGDDELESRGLVGVEDGPVLREEPHSRLVAVSAIDVVVSVLLVVVGDDAICAFARGLDIAFLPLVVDGTDKDVRPHADLLHQLNRTLGLLRTCLAPDPLHVLSVRDEIRENRLHLLPRQFFVSAVQIQDMALADIIIGADAKVHPRVDVRHRLRQVEIKDLDCDGNGEWGNGEWGMGNGKCDISSIDTGGNVSRHVRGKDELLADVLFERDGAYRLRVRKAGAHRGERLLLLEKRV